MSCIEHSPGKGRNYRRAEASAYLKANYGLSYTRATLAKLAVIGGGPAYHAGSRFPLYPEASLDAWARQKLGPLVRSSSEAIRVTELVRAAEVRARKHGEARHVAA